MSLQIFKWTLSSDTKLFKEKKINGHIFIDSPLIRRGNSTWNVRGNYINFETRIYVEIMTSIRRGNLYMDSTFKIDEISIISPPGLFYVVSTSNRRNFCSLCFHSISF